MTTMIYIGTPASPYYSPFPGGHPVNFRRSESLSNIGALVTAFLAILATGGPTYSFGVYAATLKTTLDLTQGQIETLGAASFAAGLISWIPGLAVDAWGPRQALLVGGAGQCIGFVLYWIVARFAYITLPSALWVPILSCLSVLAFTSNNLVIGGVFKSLVVSCELGTKGKAVGAGKAFLGLGAGVYSCVFKIVQNTAGLPSDLDFLAMSSVLAVISIMLPAALGLPSKKNVEKYGVWDDSTSQHYTLLYTGLFCLSMVVVGTSAVAFLFPGSNAESQRSQCPEWLRGVLIVFLWVGPVLGLFLVPTKRHLDSSRKARINQSIHRQRARAAADATPVISERTKLFLPPVATFDSKPNELTEREEDFIEICETPKSVQDRNLVQMLQTVEAWLLLLSATILVGSGTMLTINMGQMVQALGYKVSAASACLAIFSVSQALARVATGELSESALQWPVRVFGISGVPRTAFLVLSCTFAVSGHAFLAVAGKQRAMFVLGIIMTGLSFGALWPLMVLIMGDLFGTVNHGANYMFADGFTCAVGTLTIAKFLSQAVYQAHLLPSSSECFGEDCFRVTHWVVVGLCSFSLAASVLLCYTTRSSYGMVR
eukprot:scaffold3079_cov174-Amphora_coffeaeformis.AAC.31